MKHAAPADAVCSQTGLATIARGAAYLSVCPSKLRRMAASGECPTRRIGTSIRIPWAWLHEQAAVPEEAAA